jgi:hypothetical protein
MKSHRGVVVVALLATLQARGFGYVHHTGPTPERIDEIRANPKPILVTLADGQTVKFSDPVIERDSILEGYESRVRHAVALEDVTSIQDRDFQQWRTAFLAVIPIALAGIIALLVAVGDAFPPS